MKSSPSDPSDRFISLDATPDGRDVLIKQLLIKSPSLRQRLMELGLNVETIVRKRTVSGGVICEIGRARFALGQKVCRQIKVELTPAVAESH